MVKRKDFLNPAEKARKEERKKELKKNKIRRQQARSEALERHAKLEVHKKAAKESEAIKAAQEVKIEDVFLPPEPSLPPVRGVDDVYITPLTDGVKPPGCPPGPPPDLKLLLAQQLIPPSPPHYTQPRAKMRIAERKSVIESKPIIFKPKATKFVPSSVRYKTTE